MSQPQPIASTDVRQRNFETLYAWLIKTIGERRYSRVNNILEFGCGKGGFIDLYRRPGQSGFAIDLHDYSEHYPQDIRFLLPRADGCIPLVDQSIDLIVSHSVVEHLTEPAKVFADLNRVLKVGGLAFISVSPLYFSPTGSHMRHLPDWDHLNPASEHYMTKSPLGGDGRAGSHLNQYTVKDFLCEVAELPWNIVRFERRLVSDKVVPDFVERGRWSMLDLMTREFRLVAERIA